MGQLQGGEVIRRSVRTTFLRTHQAITRAQNELSNGHLNIIDFLRRAVHFSSNIENNLRNWANNVGQGNVDYLLDSEEPQNLEIVHSLQDDSNHIHFFPADLDDEYQHGNGPEGTINFFR